MLARMRTLALRLALPLGLAVTVAGSAAPDHDAIKSLPTYGPLKTKQFAGFVDATPDGKNQLHYWFVESQRPTKDTPLLVWLNGGPGASSLTGLFAENLGPQSITSNATLIDNPDTITSKYHLLTVDNPVGSGYSFTENKAYVKTEEEVRAQFVHGLRAFFARHLEYSENPLWVTGESYAGHYCPNIALEIAVNATEIPLRGVIIGNGLYNMKTQYSSISKFAYGSGVIDEQQKTEMEGRQEKCVAEIKANPKTAGRFCENITVKWLYSDKPGAAGTLFYYDMGLSDGAWFDHLTDAMSKYLNREDVKAAVHAEGAEWLQSDETGPVAAALLADWAVDSDTVVEELLGMGLDVRMYNGVRDGSCCNHFGNLAVLNQLDWGGQASFKASANTPWPSSSTVNGYVRKSSDGKLQYATLLRTGHLVPTVVPKVFAAMIDEFTK